MGHSAMKQGQPVVSRYVCPAGEEQRYDQKQKKNDEVSDFIGQLKRKSVA